MGHLQRGCVFLVGNRWIWANDNVLTKKGNCASVTRDDERTVVRIVDKYITQINANLRSKPTFLTNSEGKKEALPVYLSFFYRCAKPGKLTVKFENVDKTGFENFNSMEVGGGNRSDNRLCAILLRWLVERYRRFQAVIYRRNLFVYARVIDRQGGGLNLQVPHSVRAIGEAG